LPSFVAPPGWLGIAVGGGRTGARAAPASAFAAAPSVGADAADVLWATDLCRCRRWAPKAPEPCLRHTACPTPLADLVHRRKLALWVAAALLTTHRALDPSEKPCGPSQPVAERNPVAFAESAVIVQFAAQPPFEQVNRAVQRSVTVPEA
jgi:hypothetical protein